MHVSTFTYSLLLIVDELSTLSFELDRCLPFAEVLGLLDAVTPGYGTLSELTERADARLQGV